MILGIENFEGIRFLLDKKLLKTSRINQNYFRSYMCNDGLSWEKSKRSNRLLGWWKKIVDRCQQIYIKVC